MNFKVSSILATTVLSITACASAPPVQQNIEKSRTVNQSFDKSWENVISFFAEENISIQTLEKDSGLIVASAEYTNASTLMKYATCQTGPLETPQISRAKYNVFARKISETETKVQVNAIFNQTTLGQLSNQTFNRVCVSNGTLEQLILDATTNGI